MICLPGCADVTTRSACLQYYQSLEHALGLIALNQLAIRMCGAVFGYDIQKVDVYQERFIVARTQGTLMLGDLESCKLSEVPWESDLSERFFFDSDKVCGYTAGDILRLGLLHLPTLLT
jgi:hypothetical protein